MLLKLLEAASGMQLRASAGGGGGETGKKTAFASVNDSCASYFLLSRGKGGGGEYSAETALDDATFARVLGAIRRTFERGLSKGPKLRAKWRPHGAARGGAGTYSNPALTRKYSTKFVCNEG